MPNPNGLIWRRCRAKMQLTSDACAEKLGITGGALRQIETNVKPVSLQLAFRAEELFRTVETSLTVDDLIVSEETQPKPAPEPEKRPAQPKVERTGPARREDRKGPPRPAAEADHSAVGVA